MDEVAKFKKHAAECRQMARKATGEARATLEQMAKTWDGMAKDRERRIHRASNQTKTPH
jgi:hypothetical protein